MWSQNRDDCSPERLLLQVATATACFPIVVDAIDDDAVRFYQRFDFEAFPDLSGLHPFSASILSKVQ